ncbi:ATP-binding protein [Mycolicibacterium vaccae]|uniref:Regulatory protein LuxR n=1 Tax=Mycolicibacterium vaccae ATCC 25954 TaxID=1194972 RepID=K0V405_MYCVA|nr:adenylate/guanylate cyclase domain-containing protein [Mycolicibacterium vaccae]ANI38139.1 ATPase [Mycolicibacterium vaccae 95051]EJZ12175.1 regulatory protein LuxR [Mycolicibacterium vaccae ATCC 25954]MCV7060951.1 adenylate/guanylate cyclase domain-containing protein [Mycolicibacterium vaccae]
MSALKPSGQCGPTRPDLSWTGEQNRCLPTGTVTLLLADIEGSTRLWDSQPEQMAAALATMDRVVDELAYLNNGVCPVQQGEGDSFVLAFARADDAVACALDLQLAQLSPIRLRIGIHTGAADLRDEGNYMGPLVNRAARVRDLGHGGQTLMSSATAHLICDTLPPQTWLKDLGSYPLRGLTRPERITQLCHPDSGNEFPPLRSGQIGTFHHRPVYLTEFVGRSAELDDLGTLLDGRRLITLCGPGGAGKTRLAAEVADRARDRFDDGVWYVDLAGVTDPAEVPHAAAQALGLAGPVGATELAGHIGDRNLLLVVDNCEHLLDAGASLIGAVLGACPAATVLAASREPLAISGEQLYRVPPMSPEDATALFVECARRANAGFALRCDDRATVAQICHRLDGLPLAIEIVASRSRTLSLSEIRDSLRAGLDASHPGCRTVAPRHRTLRACLDWSYRRLGDSEKSLLNELARSADGFDADGAPDVVTALVDKSLLTPHVHEGRTQYRLGEAVRQYTLECTGS